MKLPAVPALERNRESSKCKEFSFYYIISSLTPQHNGALLPSDLIAKINLSQRALIHYDLFAISRVLPTVPKIRLSCIFCTLFPLRRSDDKGHSIRWITFHPALDKNPLNLDRRKLGADIKGFNIGIDGFFVFPSSWINKGFPG